MKKIEVKKYDHCEHIVIVYELEEKYIDVEDVDYDDICVWNKVDLFDYYVGEKVNDDEKSLAYSITFGDDNRTLSDDEVMNVFNKIIKDVENNLNAKLRN